MTKPTRLTQSVSCAGCASKLSPQLLRQAVFKMSQPFNPNLLVGFDKADDAGVFKISENEALIQTVDFFTPIVDDPYDYGQIAAANALSDVYAMGGKPLTGLNILCYPEKMGPLPLKRILKGGLDKLTEAGCTLLGGHSVNDDALKYGVAVTGLIHPKRIFSNDKALPGQILVLTKKIGTGIIVTAAKYKSCPPRLLKNTIKQMATLNKEACLAMLQTSATACTDITGFSFLGHLSELVRASKVAVTLFLKNIPLLEGALELAKKGHQTAAEPKNRAYSLKINLSKIDKAFQSVLFDPQTSGGLLVSMPKEDFSAFQSQLQSVGQDAWIVGEINQKHAQGSLDIK
jgi:selenide,water dikinase